LTTVGIDVSELNRHGLALQVAEQSVRHIKPLLRGKRFVVSTAIVSTGSRALTLAQQVFEGASKLLCADSTVMLKLALGGELEFEFTPPLEEAVRRAGLGALLV